MKKFLALLSIVMIAALAAPALADNAKGKGHSNRNKHVEKQYRAEKNDDDVRIAISIGDSDRIIIRDYMRDRYVKNCPPGLAKKRNGCLPPGQAKKRYQVGGYLDHDIAFTPVSGYLLDHLRPVPNGYMYVNVDKDVLLISTATKKVIDAVTLLSAVGN